MDYSDENIIDLIKKLKTGTRRPGMLLLTVTPGLFGALCAGSGTGTWKPRTCSR